MTTDWLARWHLPRSGLGVTPQLDALFRIFCGAALFGSLLILLGWEIDEPAFKAGALGLRAAQPAGALLILLATLAMFLGTAPSRAAQTVSRAIGAFLLAAGLLILVQNALDVDWGTDRLLFPDAVVSEQTGPHLRPGRPAGSAVLAFMALGWCLLTLTNRRPGFVRLYLTVAQLGLLGSTIALLAYGLNIAPLYVMGLYAQASLPGSVLVWLLFSCALIARKDQGTVAKLASESLGAISARSILAWSLSLVVVLIGIVQFASRAHWYRSELVVLFVTVTGLAIMFFGLTAHMRRLDQIDEKRRHSSSHAQRLERHAVNATEAYEQSLEDKRELVANLAHELRNPLAALSYTRDLLQLQAARGSNQDEALAVMARQIARLTTIVEQNLSAYDASRPSTQISPPA
jgi:signal transduction histidine kinase